MTNQLRPRGRPSRYAKYEALEASLPPTMTKRAKYCDGIGLFRGRSVHTVWTKVRLPHGGSYRGRSVPSGGSIEIKLGKRSSWDWAQLEAERDRLQGLADRGEPLEKASVSTFSGYSEEWLERKKSTVKGFGVLKGHVKKQLNPTFGKKTLDAITISDVNRWISRQRQTVKPSTVQRQLSTFNAIMNDAVRNSVIDENPSTKADKINGIEARQRFITEEEWQVILKTANRIEQAQDGRKEVTPQEKRGWLKHYIVWAYHSGMRRSEILNLTWRNVRRLTENHIVVEVNNTKNGKSRFVTCTDAMRSIIDHLSKLDREDGDERLFPVSLTTAKRKLTILWKASGLPDVRLHDLRRSHATILIGKGIDVRTVAGRLGHTGTGMLAKHYAVDTGDMEAAKIFE